MSSSRRQLVGLCIGTGGPDSISESDVEELLALATRLRVEPYLLDRLGPEAAGHSGSPPWLDELRQRTAERSVANLRRDATTRKLLTELSRRGVPVMLLKGTALRWGRVGSSGRYQSDVDLLVRQRDVEAAESVLREAEFAFHSGWATREEYGRDHFHYPYQNGTSTVELHWDIAQRSPDGFLERLWLASEPVEADRPGWRVPSPTHQLLIACLHLSRHAFVAGLRWLADIAQLAHAHPVGPERLLREAGGWPRRAVFTPLWFLAAHGISGLDGAREHMQASSTDRLLLRELLTSHAVDQKWLGLPLWLTERAVLTWLGTRRSLSAVLLEELRRAALHRARRARTGRQPPAAG